MKNAIVTIGSAPADKVMPKLADVLQLPTIKIARFTPEAEAALLSQPIIVHVPKSKIAKTISLVDECATLALLEQTVSIKPKESLGYIQNIPQNELSDIQLNFHFVASTKDQSTLDHLPNILSIAANMKVSSNTGKIDYSRLEDEMLETLPAKKQLSSYIPNARKHSYKKVLGVTTRASSIKGAGNAKD